MIYLIYILLVPVSLLLTLLAVILAPVLPLFVKDGWLPSWLSWFQTPDNWLYGDDTFMSLHTRNYWSMVQWLWRNPCYSFALKYIDGAAPAIYSGDNTIKDNAGAKEGWLFVVAGGLFQFTYVKQIFNTQRCIYINLGWNIRALVDPNVNPKPNPYQATFVFSPRISGFY